MVRGLRRFTLRTRLCLIVAIILAPALILAGMLSLRSIAAERIHIEEGIGRTLSHLSVEIDREIQSTTALLVVLAGSHYLQIDDLEGFHRYASEISNELGIQIVVHRPQLDKRIISTGVPWNETPELTMPAVRLEAEQQAIQTGKTVISDVFFGPVGQRLLVSAIMPVMRNGTAEYVLSIGIPIRTFSEILENAPPGEGRLAVVLDRSKTVVARTEKSELFAGTKILSEFAYRTSGTEGVLDHTNREGIPLHWVFRRLQPTGWLVTVGVKTAVLDASAKAEEDHYRCSRMQDGPKSAPRLPQQRRGRRIAVGNFPGLEQDVERGRGRHRFAAREPRRQLKGARTSARAPRQYQAPAGLPSRPFDSSGRAVHSAGDRKEQPRARGRPQR